MLRRFESHTMNDLRAITSYLRSYTSRHQYICKASANSDPVSFHGSKRSAVAGVDRLLCMANGGLQTLPRI